MFSKSNVAIPLGEISLLVKFKTSLSGIFTGGGGVGVGVGVGVGFGVEVGVGGGVEVGVGGGGGWFAA
jgi:hypothetical protein